MLDGWLHTLPERFEQQGKTGTWLPAAADSCDFSMPSNANIIKVFVKRSELWFAYY